MIGLTVSGFVKVWILTGNESRSSEPIYEQEFKQIKPLNALTLTCNTYNQSTVLIVCAKYWQVKPHTATLLISRILTSSLRNYRFMTLMTFRYYFLSTTNSAKGGQEANSCPLKKFSSGPMLERATFINFLGSKCLSLSKDSQLSERSKRILGIHHIEFKKKISVIVRCSQHADIN